MRSYWTTEYVGSHTNIFIKKLERALDVSALDKEVERVILNGKNVEKADFFIECRAKDWMELVYRMIELSGRLSRDIRLFGDVSSDLHGSLDISEAGGRVQAPSGLLAVRWHIRSDQTYQRPKYLTTNQKPMW